MEVRVILCIYQNVSIKHTEVGVAEIQQEGNTSQDGPSRPPECSELDSSVNSSMSSIGLNRSFLFNLNSITDN